jgi:hypothetical protein
VANNPVGSRLYDSQGYLIGQPGLVGERPWRGTAFPTVPAPVADDLFYRTDLNWLCFYDGTEWMTVQEYTVTLPTSTLSADGSGNSYVPVGDYYAVYITHVVFHTLVASTNDGSNYWTVLLRGAEITTAVQTTIWSFTTAADTVGVWKSHETLDPTTPQPSERNWLHYRGEKTNAPGNLSVLATVYYRLRFT